MDDGGFNIVQIFERVHNLHDDGPSLLLRHELVLLQVEIQVVAVAVLHNSAKPVRRDGGGVKSPTTKVNQYSQFSMGTNVSVSSEK